MPSTTDLTSPTKQASPAPILSINVGSSSFTILIPCSPSLDKQTKPDSPLVIIVLQENLSVISFMILIFVPLSTMFSNAGYWFMSLKSFHIFFIIVCALLMIFVSNWALSESIPMFIGSVVSFFILIYYGYTTFQKLKALPKWSFV